MNAEKQMSLIEYSEKRGFILMELGKSLGEKETSFLDMAELVSNLSKCCRRKVGAVITHNNKVLSTGYNGPPSGMIHCDEIGCIRELYNIESGKNQELCRGLHAEQNAIIQLVSNVIVNDSDNLVLYCTNFPCVICAKMIIQTGIKKVYASGSYPDFLSVNMLLEKGTEVYFLDESTKVWFKFCPINRDYIHLYSKI